jgi:hypothetical protein
MGLMLGRGFCAGCVLLVRSFRVVVAELLGLMLMVVPEWVRDGANLANTYS